MLEEGCGDPAAPSCLLDVDLLDLVVVNDDEADHVAVDGRNCGLSETGGHSTPEVDLPTMAVQRDGHVPDVPVAPSTAPDRGNQIAVGGRRRTKENNTVTGVICFHSDDFSEVPITGQVLFDSYIDAGAFVSVQLINTLAPRRASDAAVPRAVLLQSIADAIAVDPRSVAQLRVRDLPSFAELAGRLREVFDDIDAGDTDAAASRLNRLLATHPAHPYLAKEDDRWRMHHHSVDAPLVPMWTSICAENLARMFGAGIEDRLGTCAVEDCRRVFIDVSKNASRRFCSTACQNRVKSAAFRQRRANRGA